MACGNDQVPPASTTVPPTTVPPTTVPPTTEAAPTTAALPTSTTAPTTTIAAPRCGQPAVGAGATSVTTKSGNFDGNGAADTLRAYKLGDEWHLRVELDGGTAGGDVVVPGVDPGSGLKALGGFSLDENFVDEAFAVVGAGASSTLVGIFVFKDCALIRVTEKGSPAALSVGASVLNRSGISCVLRTALQTLKDTAPPATGTPFTVVRSTYDLVGSTLVLANTSQTTIDSNDPALAPSAALDCGQLSLK